MSPTETSTDQQSTARGEVDAGSDPVPALGGGPARPGGGGADYERYASAFCRKLMNPNTTDDERLVMAATLAAEAYDSDRGWKVLVKDGLARISFQFASPGLLANHNFSAQLYADVNNPYVPGGCIAIAFEGTQYMKGTWLNAVGDVWSDMESTEIRRLGVVNGKTLPGAGPASPLYVAQGFEGVAAQAVKMVEQLTQQYPEFLPTSGDVKVQLLTGQSMGGAIAGVIAHAIEHFNLQIRLPGPPDANGIGTCPTADSPIARVVNGEGAYLLQAPRAIAVVAPGVLPAKPKVRHLYQPLDGVPQLPTTDLRSVFLGVPGLPAIPWALPTTVLSSYTNWPNATAISWNTAGKPTYSTFGFSTPGATTPWFTIPAVTISQSFVTGVEGGQPCTENPRGRALNMAGNVSCDGNTWAGIVGSGPPKNLDSRSGFVKYAFGYTAGRLPDDNFGGTRFDNNMNNRYPAQLAGPFPIPPDSAVGKTCPYGVFCNNPVSTGALVGQMLRPLLNALLFGPAGVFKEGMFVWNPFGTATFVEELAEATLGTYWFHNPVTISVAVGRIFNPNLMIDTLNQIPIAQGTPFVPKFTCGPQNTGIVGVSCGSLGVPTLPGGPLPVACAVSL